MREHDTCPFCLAPSAPMIHDSDKSRAYECQECGAIKWITKGESGGWWYHGWQQLDSDDEPGERVNGDGVRARAPIRYLEWARLATGGDLDVLNFA